MTHGCGGSGAAGGVSEEQTGVDIGAAQATDGRVYGAVVWGHVWGPETRPEGDPVLFGREADAKGFVYRPQPRVVDPGTAEVAEAD